MRKNIRLLGAILFFFFCVQIINAGPAYEILKKKGSCLVKIVKIGTLTENEISYIIPKILYFMQNKGLTKIRIKIQNKNAEMIITKLEHIYSDNSFWQVVYTKETFGYFCYNLQKFGKNLKSDEFQFYKGLLCNDLASKKMTRSMIFNIFRLMDFFKKYSPKK